MLVGKMAFDQKAWHLVEFYSLSIAYGSMTFGQKPFGQMTFRIYKAGLICEQFFTVLVNDWLD
jgi:hypothetical protein